MTSCPICASARRPPPRRPQIVALTATCHPEFDRTSPPVGSHARHFIAVSIVPTRLESSRRRRRDKLRRSGEIVERADGTDRVRRTRRANLSSRACEPHVRVLGYTRSGLAGPLRRAGRLLPASSTPSARRTPSAWASTRPIRLSIITDCPARSGLLSEVGARDATGFRPSPVLFNPPTRASTILHRRQLPPPAPTSRQSTARSRRSSRRHDRVSNDLASRSGSDDMASTRPPISRRRAHERGGGPRLASRVHVRGDRVTLAGTTSRLDGAGSGALATALPVGRSADRSRRALGRADSRSSRCAARSGSARRASPAIDPRSRKRHRAPTSPRLARASTVLSSPGAPQPTTRCAASSTSYHNGCLRPTSSGLAIAGRNECGTASDSGGEASGRGDRKA